MWCCGCNGSYPKKGDLNAVTEWTAAVPIQVLKVSCGVAAGPVWPDGLCAVDAVEVGGPLTKLFSFISEFECFFHTDLATIEQTRCCFWHRSPHSSYWQIKGLYFRPASASAACCSEAEGESTARGFGWPVMSFPSQNVFHYMGPFCYTTIIFGQ